MKVPARAHELPDGLVCEPRDVSIRAVQAHFIKHPMGMGELRSGTRHGKRRWNAEAWDETVPPVVSLERRRALVERIRALEVGGDRCQVDRIHKESLGGTLHQTGEECYECPAELVEACMGAIEEEVATYLSFVDTLLAAVSSEPTIKVSHLALHDRVFSALPGSQQLEGLTVFSIRQGPSQKRGLIARLTAWHGVRVEFYLNRGAELAWRTLLRVPTGTPRGIGKALLEDSFPNGGPECPLSEMVLVPRLWWESHD